MSDSVAALPSAATISRKLRDVVLSIHQSGNADDLTVKRVRSKAEEELGLASGFFKTNQEWKQRSHDTIHEAVDEYCRDDPPEPAASTPKKAAKPKPKAAAKKAKPSSDSPRGVKRKAALPVKKPQKRSKVVESDDESELSDLAPGADSRSDVEAEPPQKPVQRNTKVVKEDSDEENTPAQASKSVPNNEGQGDLSESELSSLIDEDPVPKRKKKAQSATRKEPKAKAPKAPKAKGKATKSKTEDDPEQAEIKRLQGWLVKCGIRKVWSKELAKCDTPREKIKHLKSMLADAGMEGKYSNEKAARIKEQREFAKDLEDIQQGELAWGKSREEDTSTRPRRRLNQPLRRSVIEDDEDEDGDNQKNEKDESDAGAGVQGKSDDDGDDDSE